MIGQNTTDLYTEIYVGGGNFITQSAPTNFHTFFTRKVLTHSDDISNYREVTATERAAIEQSDAAWVRPPQAFIDMWNRECAYKGVADYFGRYNEQTGYFELNGITDITYEEALRIWARSEHGHMAYSSTPLYRYKFSSGGAWAETRDYVNCRTYFPIKCNAGYSAGDLQSAFKGNTIVEAIAFVSGYGACFSNFGNMKETFSGCTKLRRIIGNIGYPYLDNNTFMECESLEELDISMYADGDTFGNLNLQWSPNLSDESIARIINKAKLQKPENSMSLVLHPAAYARVTDELFATALEKNINISTTT